MRQTRPFSSIILLLLFLSLITYTYAAITDKYDTFENNDIESLSRTRYDKRYKINLSKRRYSSEKTETTETTKTIKITKTIKNSKNSKTSKNTAPLTTPTAPPKSPSLFKTGSKRESTKIAYFNQGDGTWYNSSNGRGSCGLMYPDSRLVVALNHYQLDNPANPNKNKFCNRYIKIFGPNESSVVVKLTDNCFGKCYSGHVDMTPTAFVHLADLGKGVIPTYWTMLPVEYKPPKHMEKYYKPDSGPQGQPWHVGLPL